MEIIACPVLFCHKNGSSSLEYIYKKPYRTWPTTVTSFENHENAPTTTHKKPYTFLHVFLDEYTQFSTPSPLPPLLLKQGTG